MALPTAMLLVDYAARGKTTPGAWPQAAARRLPESLLDDALGVRAVLGHGDGLRRFLLLSLPAGHAGHRSWPALRRYLGELGTDGIAELIEYGVAGNIVYGERTGYPLSAADRRTLATAGKATGDRARELRVAWLLAGWGVPDPSRIAGRVADPESFGARLLDLLDAIVEAGFERVWSEWLPGLEAAGVGAGVQPAPPGTPPREWVSRVSGLVPDPRWESWFERATTVACIPCPLLGRHLTVFATGHLGDWQHATTIGATTADTETGNAGDTVWVGYEPHPARRAATAYPATSVVGGAAGAAGVGGAAGASGTAGAARDVGRSGDVGGASGARAAGAGQVMDSASQAAGATHARDTAAATSAGAEAGAPVPRSAGEAAADLGRLGRLGQQVGALGDQTRLSILLTLATGARTAQQLSDELGVHLSTVSRQVGQLEQAGLLIVGRQSNVRHYEVDRGAVRVLCRTIEQALG
ncbi:ArsR/SmtB family transcription factor [Flindersiella endophytica]